VRGDLVLSARACPNSSLGRRTLKVLSILRQLKDHRRYFDRQLLSGTRRDLAR
jgi:hypothetical protein